eukprot:7066416-Prymnesium_polylepis.1
MTVRISASSKSTFSLSFSLRRLLSLNGMANALMAELPRYVLVSRRCSAFLLSDPRLGAARPSSPLSLVETKRMGIAGRHKSIGRPCGPLGRFGQVATSALFS